MDEYLGKLTNAIVTCMGVKEGARKVCERDIKTEKCKNDWKS